MLNDSKIIQPKRLFRILKVKDYEEAEKVFASTVGFLVYLPIGHTIQTSTCSFQKISEDLIHISSNINSEQVINYLEKTQVVKFPF